MNRKNDLYPFIFEQSVHTEVVIACFDELSKTLKKKTVVVMDNASVHTSEEFEECLPQWKKQGLIIKYLTTYSPPHSPYKKSKSLISGGCVLDRRSFELMACSGYALSHVASAWGRRIPCECNWRNRPKIS